MLLGIDHLVIAVRDPDRAAAELERLVGLAVTGGGRHETAGTFNRLAFLGDTYLELIGVFDRELAEAGTAFPVSRAALEVLDAGREGVVTYALATDDVRADASRLRAAGSPIGEPGAGSRVRPDGETVRWITAFPGLGPERPPFLIQHELEGPEWGSEARTTRARFRHPVGGVVRLGWVTLPVTDPAGLVEEYRRVLGLAFDPGRRAIVGRQTIELHAADAALPTVDLIAEPGPPHLDIALFGTRWRRRPGD